MDELRSIVKFEGTTINQFINIAVAEKLSALRIESYFRERAARENRDEFLEILNQAGTQAPREGDELP